MSNSPQFFKKPLTKAQQEALDHAQMFYDVIAATGIERQLPIERIRLLQAALAAVFEDWTNDDNAIVRHI